MSRKDFEEGRRKFLARALPAGAIFCLGCKSLMASAGILAGSQTQGPKPKYLEDIGMSADGVYRFAYEYFLPILNGIGNSLGRAKLLELIEKVQSDNYVQLVESLAKNYPGRDLKSLAKLVQDYMASAPIYQKSFSFEVTELTDKIYETKYSLCLPAKLFREMNAADIGYVVECAPAAALAKAFNPKIKLTNPKNLMKGDSVCIERFVLEA